MTERLTVESTADGGLIVQMTTALGSEGHMVIELRRPADPGLKHMQLLELQADLMARALELLQAKLLAARRLDSRPPTLP